MRSEVESLLALDAEDAEPARGGAELAEGDRVDGESSYRIRGRLGEGGMGSVYLAERLAEGFSQQVALKVLRGALRSEEAVRRFEAERRILSRLDHPGIARLIDGGRLPDGSPFLAMELVEGRQLDVACREDGRDIVGRLQLFLQVCEAVQAAHQALIVHRDLKPSNILVTPGGRVRLLDFGIAKSLDAELDASLTRLGMQPFTPRYAAPEQILGEPVTAATDVYSLGVVLFELLAGVSPYSERDLSAPGRLLLAICQDDPKPPSTSASGSGQSLEGESELLVRRRLKGDLDAIVLRALRKRPADRYGSVAELAEDLRRHLEGLPVRAREGGVIYRAQRFARRHRIAVTAGVLVVALLLGWAVTLREQLARAARERTRAEAVTDFVEGLFESADPEGLEPRVETPLQLVERGIARIDVDLVDQPGLRARLQLTLGAISWNLDVLDQAYELLSAAEERTEDLTERERLKLGQAMIGVLLDQGELESAQERLDAVMELARSLGDEEAVLSLRSQRALILDENGQSRDAAALYEEILAAALARAGFAELPATWGDVRGRRDLHLVSRTLYNLGASLEQLARWDEALERHRQALDLRRAVVGDGHPGLVRSSNAIGNILSEQGRYEAARESYLRGLELSEGQQAESVERGLLLLNLAGTERSLELLDEAAAHLEEARTIIEASRGPNHPWTAIVLGNLGNVRRDQERTEEALALQEESLRRLEAHYGASHFRVAVVLVNVANALSDLGRTEEALEAERRALQIHREVDGEDHPRTFSAMLRVAGSLEELGRFEEAVILARGAAEGLEAAEDGTGALQRARFVLGKALYASAEDAAGRAEALQMVRQVREDLEGLESHDWLGPEEVESWLRESGG